MEKVYPDVSRKSLPAKCRLKSEGGCILYEVKHRSEHCWKGWLKLSNSSNWTVWPALEGSLQVLTPEYMNAFHNLQTCTHTHPKYFSSCITAAILQTILKSTILQSEYNILQSTILHKLYYITKWHIWLILSQMCHFMCCLLCVSVSCCYWWHRVWLRSSGF